MRRRAQALAALAALAPMMAAAPALARQSVLYDTVEARTAIQLGGLSPADGILEQHPATGVFPASTRAFKVTGGAATAGTPSLAGLTGPQMADTLRERVQASPAHVVFVDELSQPFRGANGDNLAAALAQLATEVSPYPGGGTIADRVHLYMPTPGPLLAQPDSGPERGGRRHSRAACGWRPTPAARWPGSRAPGPPSNGLTWPRAVRDQVLASGGNADRLHLVLPR